MFSVEVLRAMWIRKRSTEAWPKESHGFDLTLDSHRRVYYAPTFIVWLSLSYPISCRNVSVEFRQQCRADARSTRPCGSSNLIRTGGHPNTSCRAVYNGCYRRVAANYSRKRTYVVQVHLMYIRMLKGEQAINCCPEISARGTNNSVRRKKVYGGGQHSSVRTSSLKRLVRRHRCSCAGAPSLRAYTMN